MQVNFLLQVSGVVFKQSNQQKLSDDEEHPPPPPPETRSNVKGSSKKSRWIF